MLVHSNVYANFILSIFQQLKCQMPDLLGQKNRLGQFVSVGSLSV